MRKRRRHSRWPARHGKSPVFHRKCCHPESVKHRSPRITRIDANKDVKTDEARMTNDERMTKPEEPTRKVRSGEKLAAQDGESQDAYDRSSNPSARCALALPNPPPPSSFGFPSFF